MKGLLILLSISAVAIPIAFYSWQEHKARQITEEQQLAQNCANALKHASAAAAIHTALRAAMFEDDLASEITEKLGALNEQMEVLVKRGRPDDQSEVKKDIYNNFVGVTLSKFLLKHPQLDRRSILGKLCQVNILITDKDAINTQNQPQKINLDTAYKWLESHKSKIRDEFANFSQNF